MRLEPFSEWMYKNSPSVRRTVDNMIPKGVRETWDREVAYWSSPRGEYELKSFATGLPFGVGDFIKSLMKHNDAMEQMDRGLARYGMTYDDIDILTNTLAFNTGGNLVSSGFNFVSSNVGRLYR